MSIDPVLLQFARDLHAALEVAEADRHPLNAAAADMLAALEAVQSEVLLPGQLAVVVGDAIEKATGAAVVTEASPDVLAALREAVDLYECYGLVAAAVPGDPMRAGRWINSARAALAKAEKRDG